MCRGFSALVWRSWIARRKEEVATADHDQNSPFLPQDRADVESAAREMSRWWRKYVSVEPRYRHNDGLVPPKVRISLGVNGAALSFLDVARVRSSTSRGVSEQSRFLQHLIASVIAARPRLWSGGRTVARITVCRGLPPWAEQILGVMTPLFVDCAEGDDDDDDEEEAAATAMKDNDNEEKEVLAGTGASFRGDVTQAVRQAVVADPVLRPHIRNLIPMAAHFKVRRVVFVCCDAVCCVVFATQTWFGGQAVMLEGGLASVREASFDEETFIRRLAHFIARQTGVTAVEVLPGVGATLAIGQPLFAPGLPLVEVVPVQ